ncbi:MAG: 50S ribosomal protein L9 [Candidatus Omnitrophota bacterium]|nr:50S ribosomal protein L9 [Candidatus Omnitrophota bacterium]
MEIILRKDVDKIGKSGEVIKVKKGFARNFLLPRGLAFVATNQNLKRLEQEKQQRQVFAEKEKRQAEELAKKLSGASCTVAVDVNENEKMYGSVTAADIVKSLEVESFKIDKNAILLEKPIEELGIFEIEIKLHPEVKTKIRLWVTKR